MTRIAVAPLEETQIVAAGRILASAFHNDPLQTYVYSDADERAQRSPAQFSALVREGFYRGEVFVSGQIAGVSVWMPPASLAKLEMPSQSEFRQLPRLMGDNAFQRFGRILDFLSAAHATGMPTEHWYLMIVGVHPKEQRRGYGRALIEPMIARADASGLPICLDTAQPSVRAFYEELGFTAIIETVDPDSDLRFWTYRHDPP